jgi:hypothetical protein
VVIVALPALRAQELQLSEILYDPIGANTGQQAVEIQNPGAAPVAVGDLGYHLRYPPVAWPFPAGSVVPAGGILVVRINTLGTNTSSEVFTGTGGQRNLRFTDSLALYRSSQFQDPANLVDFLEWGAGGQIGEAEAVAAGLWAAGDFVGVGGMRPGATLARRDPAPGSASWCVDGSPTVGAANDACTTASVSSQVRLNEAGYTGLPGSEHPFIELKHTGVRLEDLGGMRLGLGGEHFYEFQPNVLVAPSELVVLHLGVDGEDAGLEFFSGAGTFRDLQAADVVSLHLGGPSSDPTRLVDFVQWGAAGSALEAVAVAAGRWEPGAAVDVSDRRALGSVAVLREAAPAARWGVDNTPTAGGENDHAPQPPRLVINEVLLDPPGIAAGSQALELANTDSQAPFDASGTTLVFIPRAAGDPSFAFTVPQGQVVPGGGFLVVRLNRSGSSSAAEVFTGPLRELEPQGGEIGLFLTPNVEDSNNLIDYLRWGSGATRMEATAADLLLWPRGDSVDVGALRDNSSLAYLDDGDDAMSYRIDITPSLGMPNPELPAMLPFRRGDCNDDGEADISDAIRTFQFLFAGGREPLCRDACDSNDDAVVDISDPIFVLGFLFRGGASPPAPAPTGPCGEDRSADDLTCDSYVSC